MNIIHVKEEKSGGFVASDDLAEVGRITYVMSGPTKIILNHTEVNPAHEGQGIATELVLTVVEYARANELKILPTCVFAKALFDKTPEIRDVLF